MSQSLFPTNDYDVLIVPKFAVLFGGLAFVDYFFFSRKMMLKEEKEDKENERKLLFENEMINNG